MKILRLLSKKNLTIIFFLFFGLVSYAEESTVDIWNIDKKKTENNSSNLESSNVDIKETETTDENSIYKMQKKKNNFLISLDNDLGSKEIKIFGLYDPEDYDLDIEMWSNSNGDQIKNIFSKLDKIKLSDDANELMKISLLTNSYAPKNNITGGYIITFFITIGLSAIKKWW